MGDRVLVGRVVKPHGIRGEVVVDVLSDVEGRFAVGTVYEVGNECLTVAATRPHQRRLLVTFEEISDRTQAEHLRGARLEAERIDGHAGESFLVADLLGLRVTDDRGTDLGSVVEVIEIAAAAGYHLLEIRRADGGTWLLPAVDDFVEVREGQTETTLVVTDLPDGLTDL